MRIVLAGILSVLFVVVAGCGKDTKTVTQSSARLEGVTLPEEVGTGLCHQGREHPERFALGCGMGLRMIGLKWRHWAEPVSYAYGTARVNDCYPDCARGSYTDHRIELIAYQIETCASGERRYTRLVWTYPDGNPSGEEASADQQSFKIDCPNT